MLLLVTALSFQAAFAVPFPPPTGPYHVGYSQFVFDHTTQHDPLAPQNASFLLATVYYPTLSVPITGINTAPYSDVITAKSWGVQFELPSSALPSLTTWNVLDAPPFDEATHSTSRKPTVIFSPGAQQNAIMYNWLNADLASQGFTVFALDHPGEAPYLQLPDRPGIYAAYSSDDWTRSMLDAVYRVRVSDMLALICEIPSYTAARGAPFNTSHFIAIGHSLGGAAAAEVLAVSDAVVGGINLDGLFIDTPDVGKPFLMVASEPHTPARDATWAPFSANKSGEYAWFNITGSVHEDFADVGDWVDLLGLRNQTIAPLLGTVWGPRMNVIVQTTVQAFLRLLLGHKELTSGLFPIFPELVYLNGSSEVAG
ncbi:hypothetical protein E8E13_009758 [Curvularia kusanoi]|uniref:1-alkyl-2-acetylglycerophosphocholine esterase n=1 Tax=Curvularia kusanoi TaxID=90978 RepID=A0A9P4TC30_CURKU|nr:hypothetical protein E8E13_009758 [Curvularia kusanoi]